MRSLHKIVNVTSSNLHFTRLVKYKISQFLMQNKSICQLQHYKLKNFS
ncbi:50S ribosomal protein L25 [Peptoniphilus lacrimalis]|uniref:50S ribosomal protein L25 domain protein n=2 Tax=Gardnerella pickettii TaxID=2914924 RepID=T2PLQ6_9BIFI|nr:hypothetical protein HMPREF1576_00826 [Gardnerella pickettii JCP7719]EPI52846.1 hypothetical protein HMPREF1577_00399 [Gardnerella pickettii JCP8017A]EPI62295.1 hypothetical protein HMPREF1578_00130 [Gardnerella pickettii JCP8017B]PMC45543.1 50S ribosomal protein L25 [Peptoniphilus lacrimalis]